MPNVTVRQNQTTGRLGLGIESPVFVALVGQKGIDKAVFGSLHQDSSVSSAVADLHIPL